MVHSVGGTELLMRLRKDIKPEMPWINHGFRGKSPLARQLIQHGFYLSLGEHYNPEALKAIPLERLFLESDESDLDIHTLYQKVADGFQMDPSSLKACIQQNIRKVFFGG